MHIQLGIPDTVNSKWYNKQWLRIDSTTFHTWILLMKIYCCTTKILVALKNNFSIVVL